VLPRPKQIPGLPVERFMESEKDQDMLMRKLSMDFASELRKIQYTVDRVIFTMDAKSWRKDFFPESGYKANRVQDEKIDWKGINKVTDEFQRIIRKKGVIVDRVAGAEGDDMIFAWTTHLNASGENAIVWSGDKDLIQLVNYNRSTDAYTLWYDNTRSKFVGYPGFRKWLETHESKKDFADIYSPAANFYLADQVKKELKNFLSSNKLETSEVFCDEFILSKILAGDKSDNITSVCLKPSKKGDKFFRLNPKKADRVVDMFKKRHNRFSAVYLFEDEYKEEICKLVSREMKVTGKLTEIREKLELNTKLMLLHVSTIPEAIQTSMFNQIKTDLENPLELQITGLLHKDKILEGTKFIQDNKIGNSSEPPKGGVGGLF
jgi:5'-3' exonuclease